MNVRVSVGPRRVLRPLFRDLEIPNIPKGGHLEVHQKVKSYAYAGGAVEMPDGWVTGGRALTGAHDVMGRCA